MIDDCEQHASGRKPQDRPCRFLFWNVNRLIGPDLAESNPSTTVGVTANEKYLSRETAVALVKFVTLRRHLLGVDRGRDSV